VAYVNEIPAVDSDFMGVRLV